MLQRCITLILAGLVGAALMWFGLMWFGLPESRPAARQAAASNLQLVEQLAAAQEQFDSIPFRDLVRQVTGHEVIAYDPGDPTMDRMRAAVGRAADRALTFLNLPEGPARTKRRINEVSALVEQSLLKSLQQEPGLRCEIPPDQTGIQRRSGYPDLRLTDVASGCAVYLDPKLYEAKGEASTLRTFYFKPGGDTSKISESALHWLIGFRHDGASQLWHFDRWQLVDLHGFRIGLKVEFQGSNNDLYRPELNIAFPDSQELE